MNDMQELVPLAQAGDCDALGKLYQNCFRYALPVVARVLRSHPNDVEDVASIAATRAVLKIGRFAGDSKFVTWYHRIVLNEACIVLRTKKSRALDNAEPIEQETEDGVPLQIGIACIDPGFAQYEVRHDLAKILPKVTKARRNILQLRFFDGLSNEETCAATGKSLSAVKSLQHVGILMAREALARV